MRRLNAELAEKCNHEDTKTRKVRWLSSCLRAFVVAFNKIKDFSAVSAVSALNVMCSQFFRRTTGVLEMRRDRTGEKSANGLFLTRRSLLQGAGWAVAAAAGPRAASMVRLRPNTTYGAEPPKLLQYPGLKPAPRIYSSPTSPGRTRSIFSSRTRSSSPSQAVPMGICAFSSWGRQGTV